MRYEDFYFPGRLPPMRRPGGRRPIAARSTGGAFLGNIGNTASAILVQAGTPPLDALRCIAQGHRRGCGQ